MVLCHLGYFMEHIEPEVIELCNQLDFPLIVVPKTVTYIEIIVPIVNKILEISNEKTQLALEMQETLPQKVVNEEGLDSICRYIGEKLGTSIVIIDVMDKVEASFGAGTDEVELIRGALRSSREQFLTNNTYVTIHTEKDYYGYLICEINNLDLDYVLLMEVVGIEEQEVLWSVNHIFIQHHISRQVGIVQGQFIILLDGTIDGLETAQLLHEKLLKYHKGLSPEGVTVSVSNPLERRESIPEAYRITRDTLALGRRFLPETHIYECKNLAFLPYLYESAINSKFRTIAGDVLAPLAGSTIEYQQTIGEEINDKEK